MINVDVDKSYFSFHIKSISCKTETASANFFKILDDIISF